MARKGPLRKVVGYAKHPYVLTSGREIFSDWERLECGHEQPIVKDIFGETNAYRRRCKKCVGLDEE